MINCEITSFEEEIIAFWIRWVQKMCVFLKLLFIFADYVRKFIAIV